MKSRLLALLLLASGAAGCVDDRASVEIFAICTMTDDCTFANECDAQFMGAIYYTTGGAMLQLPMEIHNQVPNNEDLGSGRVNSNDAHITGGTVVYEGAAVAGVMPGDWSFFTNATIPAGGSSLAWVYLASGGIPAGAYTANLKLSGYFDNGNDFETGPFPIGLLAGTFGSFCPTGTVDACPGTGAVQNVAACVTP